MTNVITTIEDLQSILETAKCGGQFVSISGESPVNLLKKANDGSKERIKDNFAPVTRFSVTFHFGEDYEKKMSKLLGEDYKASDANRVHLVKNVLMQYISTGNTCIIYMPSNYTKSGIYLNGNPISDEDKAYMERFKSLAKPSVAIVDYRTLSVKNVKAITINHTTYKVAIGYNIQLGEVG